MNQNLHYVVIELFAGFLQLILLMQSSTAYFLEIPLNIFSTKQYDEFF